jgi:ubiquinone/menaquinone biosynthesis C-methylase UbiE
LEPTKQNKEWEIALFDRIVDEDKEYEQNSDEFYDYLTQSTRKILGDGKQKKMLEAGCGTGAIGKRLMKRFKGLKITGVDVSPKMVRLANDGTRGYRAIEGNLENEKLLAKASFDVVFCGYILHHFPSCKKIVHNAALWLKPGGYLILVEPNGSSPVNRASKAARHALEAAFGKEWVIRKRFATPNETDHTVGTYLKLLAKNGLDAVFLETKHFEAEGTALLSIGGLKERGYRLCGKIFPHSHRSGSSVLIIARKKAKK